MAVVLLGIVDAATGGMRTSLLFSGLAAGLLLMAWLRPAWSRVLAWNLGLLWLGLLILQLAAGEGRLADAKFREVLRRRSLGEDVVPTVHPQDFMDLTGISWRHRALQRPRVDGREILPLGAPAGRNTVYCREDDGWMIFRTDALGFNNPPHALDSVDTVIVGDSFVQGACVGPGYAFPDRLRQSGRAVYSLGTGGAGPLTHLAQLVEHLGRLRPRVVVWVHTAVNDLSYPGGPFCDIDLEMRDDSLRAYLERPDHHQDVVRRKAAIDEQVSRRLEERIETLQRRADQRERRRRLLSRLFLSALFDRLDDVRRYLPVQMESLPRARRLEIFEAVLDRALVATHAAGARLAFVYLPWREDFSEAMTGNVLDRVAERDIPALDLTAMLQKRPEFWARDGNHLTRSGNEAVAGALDGFLEREYPQDHGEAP